MSGGAMLKKKPLITTLWSVFFAFVNIEVRLSPGKSTHARSIQHVNTVAEIKPFNMSNGSIKKYRRKFIWPSMCLNSLK